MKISMLKLLDWVLFLMIWFPCMFLGNREISRKKELRISLLHVQNVSSTR